MWFRELGMRWCMACLPQYPVFQTSEDHGQAQWSKKLFRNARMELHMANKIIHRLDMAQDDHQLSPEEVLLRRDLKIRVMGLAAVERAWHHQASHLVWLKEGDACTCFFHLKANSQSRKKFIPCLKKTNGEYVWSHDEKEQILHEHFLNILGVAEPRQSGINWAELQLPQLAGHHLDAPFSKAKIKNAIAELTTEKAPGPDGFTGVFFRSCWDIIRTEIMAAFHCFYNQTTCPLPKLNGALLTLLPKSDIAEPPGDFSLISLIHCFAKLTSKVLALRLAPHINDLVSNA
jgi:hypothetical protein